MTARDATSNGPTSTGAPRLVKASLGNASRAGLLFFRTGTSVSTQDANSSFSSGFGPQSNSPHRGAIPRKILRGYSNQQGAPRHTHRWRCLQLVGHSDRPTVASYLSPTL